MKFKPIIVNGRIDDVAVVGKGEGYFSTPDLEIKDTGTGSEQSRPIVENGKLLTLS